MAEVSVAPPERARKTVQLVLQRLQDPGSGVAVAAAMGVSESTVSRWKTERLDEMALFLAHLGLKVVPAEFQCVDSAAYGFLTTRFEKVMREAPHLIWEAT